MSDTKDKKTEEKKEVKVEKDDSKTRQISRNAYRVLIRPLVTEKNSNQASLGKYAFEVGVNSNKVEVKKAIKEIYKVNPVSVNMIKMGGKLVQRGRYTGARKDWKKAIVTLPKGETLPIYNV